MDPIELLRRAGDLPVEPLVEALREIHEGKVRGGKPDGRRVEPEVLPPESLAVQVLRGIHERKQPRSYDDVRRHFRQHEEGLRHQASLTDRLLDRMDPEGAAPLPAPRESPLQQELRVQCPPGGESAARFVLVNEFDHPMQPRFRVRPSDSLRFSFEPEQPRLKAGEERVVRLGVALDEAAARPGERLECAVDVMDGERLMLKLWVSIAVCRRT